MSALQPGVWISQAVAQKILWVVRLVYVGLPLATSSEGMYQGPVGAGVDVSVTVEDSEDAAL